MRVAVLDDYLDVVRQVADWDSLPNGVEVTVFNDHVTDEDALIERLAGFDIIVATRERTPISRALLERLPGLKLLVAGGRHNRKIDVEAALEKGIVVTGTRKYGAAACELTWGLILALLRHIPEEDAALRQGRWHHALGRTLSDKTLGLVGLGRIGAEMAAVAKVFGMNVIAWSRNLTAERGDEVGVEVVGKYELFSHSDIVSVHLALSERSIGTIGEAELSLMKPTAYFINTARGPIVDEAALIDMLENRRIAGVAIDVFDSEPLPPDHPLLKVENTILTPHIGYVTDGTFEAYYQSAVESIEAFIADDPVPYAIEG
jgi:phosphoglycerate dehydrogenase-like enzyme